jgi:Mrp family chromosome partitioning ATPase
MKEEAAVRRVNSMRLPARSPGRRPILLPAATSVPRQLFFVALMCVFGALSALFAEVVLWGDASALAYSPVANPNLDWIYLGAGGGVAVGIALMLIFEHAAEHITSVNDIEAKSNFSPLGSAPRPDRGLLRRLSPEERHGAGLVAGAPASRFAQSYRDLFEQIVGQRQTHAIKTIALTSSYIGEDNGISYLALARAAALAGERVVIVDCDARARVLSRLLRHETSEGLETILSGANDWRKVVIQDGQTTLDIIPMGPHRDLLGDMFTAPNFDSCLASLREHWDLVVLACPPVLAAVDAAKLAHLADATVLFVGGAARLKLSILRAVDRKLRSAGAWTLGAFLVSAPQ